MSVTAQQFRDAASRFTTGVAIVTAEAEGGLCGVTVSSFVSISLEPPLISVSLAQSLKSLSDILAARRFAVSILREDQDDLAVRFSRAGTEKWAGIQPGTAPGGTPWIVPHLAGFECMQHSLHEAGDHVILLGRVVNLSVKDESPLVYFRGRLSPSSQPVVPTYQREP